MHDSATISVKFKNKKTGSTYKSAIKIKVAVEAKKAAFEVTTTEMNLVIGGSDSIAFKGNAEFKSSDEKIATVDATGKVTAVAAGKATITVTSKKDETKTADVTINVKKTKLVAVSQTKANEFTATVLGDTAKINDADFNFVQKETNVIYPINKTTVDKKDATKVTFCQLPVIWPFIALMVIVGISKFWI